MKAEKLKPRIFEIMPPSGTLQPGQKINIQVKFMPVEEVNKIIFLTLFQLIFLIQIPKILMSFCLVISK